ncbi:nuclear pore complex protein Nup153-like [Anopheles maculipalpis]|uniref:nuclear pore complex protein Nup153-like n=1 Tax=Anopheles maculipalpis TaxID=1496333 RepID=UPI002158B1F3|nr:nuclear pore complex protein Nup153-like [Anopheles maculipalpis]
MSRRGSASPSLRRRLENSDGDSSDEEDTVTANVQRNLTEPEPGMSGPSSGSNNDVSNSPDDSNSRKSDADGSFVGKIRSNFSSMLNRVLPAVRQTKQEDSVSLTRQHTERHSDVKHEALLMRDVKKRAHSPNVAADSEDTYISYSGTYEMITKRPRLREAAETKAVKSTSTSSDTFRTLSAPTTSSNLNSRLSSFLGNSVYRKRMQQLRSGSTHKTLFGSSTLKSTNSLNDTVASSRRPSFNSSVAKISKSLSTGWIPPEYGGSSFYEGLTRFGGASSARTLATHGPPRPSVTVLVKKSHPTTVKAPYPLPQIAPNETKVEKKASQMSYPAQRILEIIDEYDAKSPASKRELVARSINNLRTPTTLQMLNIIRMSEKERSEETNQTPQQPLPEPPKVPLMEYTLPVHVDKLTTSPIGKQESIKSAGGKQITKKTRLHADPIQEREETTVEPIQLPNLKLPPLLEGLPKFDFTVPMKGPLLPVDKEVGLMNAKSMNDDKKKPSGKEGSTSAPSNVPDIGTFTFSAPMVFGGSAQVTDTDHTVPDLSAPEPSVPFLCEVNKFVFASPTLFNDLSQVSTTIPVAAESDVSPPSSTPEPLPCDEHTFDFISPIVLGSPSALTDTILAMASSIVFPAPEALEDTPDVPKVRSFKELMADSATKWACDVCMIRNEPHQQTCVACESPKPTPVPSKTKEQLPAAGTNIPSSGSFAAIVSAQSNRWECTACSVRNDATASICVCCSTEKPTGTGNPGSFAAIVSAQSNNWECSACSVRNDSSASVCVCCSTEKPTGTGNSGSFAAIVSAQSNKWECSACSVRNESTASVCVCCLTAKPTHKTNSGSFAAIVSSQSNRWECPACCVRNDPTASICVCCATEKPK